MIKTLVLKCPSCNSELTVESDREQLFCQYCGTKILLKNENEYIVRQINEAEVIQAETERMVQLKQMEEAEERKEKDKKINTIIIIIAIVMGILSLTLMIGGIILSGVIPWLKDTFETLSMSGMLIGLLTAFVIVFFKIQQSEKEKDKNKK